MSLKSTSNQPKYDEKSKRNKGTTICVAFELCLCWDTMPTQGKENTGVISHLYGLKTFELDI